MHTIENRENRSNTAHNSDNYGEEFAHETLSLVEDFLTDAKNEKGKIDGA